MKELYLVDVGYLLNPNDADYDYYAYVYDKQHSYYDEYQFYSFDLEQAKQYVDNYNKYNKFNNTYGVVSFAGMFDDDFELEDNELVEDEDYLLENVIYHKLYYDNQLINIKE